jgi:hypothetical protein
MDGIGSSSTNAATSLSLIRTDDGHPRRADQRNIWGEWLGPGPGGGRLGTNGARLALACATFVLLAWAVCTVNALSILHDVARNGVSIPLWQPWVTEYTSLAGSIVALPIALAAARLSGSIRPLVARAMVVITASLCFSLLHIGVMVGLRALIWRMRGGVYRFDLGAEWLYEYRKDAVAFAILFLFLILALRLPAPQVRRGAGTAAPPPRVPLADGRRGVEVDPAELRAIHAGGNYVELIFADDRRRLLRTTLEAAESALAGHGFRRTHKSWLVRLSLVGGIERTAAGDFRLQLGDQLVVPLSRRSRAVLAEVRDQLAEPLLL